ncbi:CD63 antigen-like [Polymixia lowei]
MEASGVALIVIGARSSVTYKEIATFTGTGLSNAAILLITVGVIVAVISLLGFIGAFIDNSSVMTAFICILILIIGLEIAAGIGLYIFRSKFKCCGADGSSDWAGSAGWGKSDAVPDSCCVVTREGCGQDISTSNTHEKGCISAVKTFLLKNLVWVGAVCIALGVLEVLGVLAGTCLCLDIKRRNYQNIK